ncbi:hypothetical protein PR048_003922 [Dryococelus australis]|uniref:Uncharacterized protein n=1 Tax=Dryococelus australis TaxID=614101 RepID=A0ABQ9IPK0_9NEOP|nr:hypothetical protein PR048_003922 [Dryococelus australis]
MFTSIQRFSSQVGYIIKEISVANADGSTITNKFLPPFHGTYLTREVKTRTYGSTNIIMDFTGKTLYVILRCTRTWIILVVLASRIGHVYSRMPCFSENGVWMSHIMKLSMSYARATSDLTSMEKEGRRRVLVSSVVI